MGFEWIGDMEIDRVWGQLLIMGVVLAWAHTLSWQVRRSHMQDELESVARDNSRPSQ